MHGRPRKPLKPEDADSIAKAAKLCSLQSQLLHNHHNKIYDKEALDLCSKLLEINPEIYTGWNYRKLAVENNIQSLTDPNSIKTILDEELRVVESALRRNHKSYGAWHHRKWVLTKGFSSIDHEFLLLDQLLKLDSRNFHGWNYRRFVAALTNVPADVELKFTTDKINANFSNYSAWHNRSILLSHLLRQKAQGFFPREKVLTEEYELIHNAIFTDPDDQSGWFFHLWLLGQTVTQDGPLVVASWPTHGSSLILSRNSNMEGSFLSQFSSIHLENLLQTENIPLILYFSQPVGGVSSSTVSVKHAFDENEHFIWRPLSMNKSGKAQSWMTHLKIPSLESHTSKVYPVEVCVGYAQGIIFSSGSHCSHPSRFEFSLNIQSIFSEENSRTSDKERVVWKDENFYTIDDLLQDLSPVIESFGKLKVSEDHEVPALKWHIETLENEINLFRELLSEINCKIGKLTLARLLMAHDKMTSSRALSTHKATHSEEILELFTDLMKMDPLHSRYYKDVQSLVIMEQLISDRKSLEKLCWYYKESTCLGTNQNICVRLNKLSLSRIGFIERLLWVQMLDLSHNELQSIEGLEAMQLLTSLNISYNKFRSFTALDPLRLIKSLRVLDLSYNEIGSHSIDTTRYLCSSPLSQAIEANLKLEEYATDNVKVSEYWEAILLLKDTSLTQLDAVGNVVNDESFRMLVIKILPSLKWLDGVCIM